MASQPFEQGPLMEKILELLKKKDDTSKFVALSMIRSVLDTKSAQNPKTVQELWHIMPKPFLMRLLKALPTSSISADDAVNMNHLAVAIIHTFVNLLPSDAEQLSGFIAPLMTTIPRIGRPQQALAYQALECFVSQQPEVFVENTAAFQSLQDALQKDEWHSEHVVSLLRLARVQKPLKSTQIITWNAQMTSTLAVTEDPTLMFQMLADVADATTFTEEEKQTWKLAIIPSIKKAILKKPTSEIYRASVTLFAALLRADCSEDIFVLSGSGPRHKNEIQFAYQFVMLILIDIRSSIPSLMSSLLQPSYPATTLRLAMCFDLVTVFIHQLTVLVRTAEITGQTMGDTSFSPDQLLQLQRDLTETFSLALEYFRDRWDASVAGAPGLHPSARIPDKASKEPLQLTWDNPTLPPAKDPIVLAGMRALALWIFHDDQPQILQQTFHLLDMLLALFLASEQEEPSQTVVPIDQILPTQTGSPTFQILNALFQKSTDAVDKFLELDGWQMLTKDLKLLRGDAGEAPEAVQRQVDIFNLLLAVVDSEAVPQSREAWMEWLIPSTIEASENGTNIGSDAVLEACELSIVLFEKAPKRLQLKYGDDMEKLQGLRGGWIDGMVGKLKPLMEGEQSLVKDDIPADAEQFIRELLRLQ